MIALEDLVKELRIYNDMKKIELENKLRAFFNKQLNSEEGLTPENDLKNIFKKHRGENK